MNARPAQSLLQQRRPLTRFRRAICPWRRWRRQPVVDLVHSTGAGRRATASDRGCGYQQQAKQPVHVAGWLGWLGWASQQRGLRRSGLCRCPAATWAQRSRHSRSPARSAAKRWSTVLRAAVAGRATVRPGPAGRLTANAYRTVPPRKRNSIRSNRGAKVQARDEGLSFSSRTAAMIMVARLSA